MLVTAGFYYGCGKLVENRSGIYRSIKKLFRNKLEICSHCKNIIYTMCPIELIDYNFSNFQLEFHLEIWSRLLLIISKKIIITFLTHPGYRVPISTFLF